VVTCEESTLKSTFSAVLLAALPGAALAVATLMGTAAAAPPSPSGPAQTSSMPAAPLGPTFPSSVDLNGMWDLDVAALASGPKPKSMRILFLQIGNGVIGMLSGGEGPVPVGAAWLKSESPAAPEMKVVVVQLAPAGGIEWVESTLKLQDSEHLIIGGWMHFGRSMKRTEPVERCDPHGTLHGSAEEAFARGQLYSMVFNDAVADACWSRMSAEGNYEPAEVHYAYALWKGIGVAQDTAQAFSRFQTLSMRGSRFAAYDLAQMFATGRGAPASSQRTRYWLHRSRYLNAANVPDWANETAAPCDLANPQGVNAPRAFVQGRVAYQARALPLAACWFQVSAAQNYPKAKMYLGILYGLGLGVERDPKRGFAYMEESTKTKEPFALLYLAGFYRYGVGTERNLAQANYLERVVLEDFPNGMQMLSQVSGATEPSMQDTALINNWLGHEFGGCPTTHARLTEEELAACDRAKEDSLMGMIMNFGRGTHTMEQPEEIFPELERW